MFTEGQVRERGEGGSNRVRLKPMAVSKISAQLCSSGLLAEFLCFVFQLCEGMQLL